MSIEPIFPHKMMIGRSFDLIEPGPYSLEGSFIVPCVYSTVYFNFSFTSFIHVEFLLARFMYMMLRGGEDFSEVVTRREPHG